MFLLNRLKQYSEYNDMATAADNIRTQQVAIIDNTTAAFGGNLFTYAHSQPPEIQIGLKAIQKQGEAEVEVMKALFVNQSEFPTQLALNKEPYVEIAKRNSAIAISFEQLKKSKAIYDKTKEDLANAKTKGLQNEINKAEAACNAARTKAHTDLINFQNLSSSCEKETNNLKRKFIKLLAETMKKNSEFEVTAGRQMAQIAELMKQHVTEIHDFNDPLIPKLQERLKSLEFEATT